MKLIVYYPMRPYCFCLLAARPMLKNFLLLLIALLCGAIPLAGLAAPISVMDNTGRTVSLQKPASRIVALAPHVVESLYFAGAGSKIVGAVEYSDYPQAAKALPRVGGYSRIDLEAILALKPDLVIAWESGNSPAAIDKLRGLNIPVYLSQPNTLEQIAIEIDRFGTLAGTESIARPKAQQYRHQLASLKQRFQNRAAVRVFYQISEAPLMTIGGNQIISNALSICGGENVFVSLKPMAAVISSEAVIAANPEAIMTSGMQNINPAALDFWKKLPSLTAVRRGNLFFVDSDLVNRNGPRMLEGTQLICQSLQTARDHRPKAGANP